MKRYKNFEIDLFQYERTDSVERFRVAVGDAQRLDKAIAVEFPSGFRERIAHLNEPGLSRHELVEFGLLLGGMLLPQEVGELFDYNLNTLDSDSGLRIRLRIHSYELAPIPWEYASRGPSDLTGFLALNPLLSIVRYEVLKESPKTLDPEPARNVRVVGLFSQPTGTLPLDLTKEKENLAAALKNVPRVSSELRSNGSRQDLLDALNPEAHVFHFGGHGDYRASSVAGFETDGGRLILRRSDGQPDPITADELAVQLRHKGVRLVVLNSCEGAMRSGDDPWSGIAALLVREGIPAVIGMQFEIGDPSAKRFAEVLYSDLTAGKSIDATVARGRRELAGTRMGFSPVAWGIPVLNLRTDSGVLFPPALGRYRMNLALLVLFGALVAVWYQRHATEQTTGFWLLALIPLASTGVEMLRTFGAAYAWVQGGRFFARLGSYVQKAFNSIVTTWICSVGVTVAVVFLYVTSSLHLVYGGNSSSGAFEVQIDGDVFRSETLAPEDEAVRKRSYSLSPVNFRLHISHPPGYASLPLSLAPMKRNTIVVPNAFTRLRVVRIIPGFRIYQRLPTIHDQDTSRPYSLQYQINGGSTGTVKDLVWQPIFIGGEERDLRAVEEDEPPEFLENAVLQYVEGQPREDIIGAYMLENLGSARFERTDELMEGDTLKIEVLFADTILGNTTFIVGSSRTKGIETIFVEGL